MTQAELLSDATAKQYGLLIDALEDKRLTPLEIMKLTATIKNMPDDKNFKIIVRGIGTDYERTVLVDYFSTDSSQNADMA